MTLPPMRRQIHYEILVSPVTIASILSIFPISTKQEYRGRNNDKSKQYSWWAISPITPLTNLLDASPRQNVYIGAIKHDLQEYFWLKMERRKDGKVMAFAPDSRGWSISEKRHTIRRPTILREEHAHIAHGLVWRRS
jgi:hypothetical protein